MRIGVPKEIKTNENRIALVPAGAETLVSAGHTVMVERGAGEGSGFADSAFTDVGAKIGQPLLRCRIVERLAEGGVELGDDLVRRSGGDHHAEPERRVDLGIALLAGGRYVRQLVGARGAGNGAEGGAARRHAPRRRQA